LVEYPRSRLFYVPNTSDNIKCKDSISRINVNDSEIKIDVFNQKVFRTARKDKEISGKDKSESIQVYAVKLRKKVQQVDYLQIIRMLMGVLIDITLLEIKLRKLIKSSCLAVGKRDFCQKFI